MNVWHADILRSNDGTAALCVQFGDDFTAEIMPGVLRRHVLAAIQRLARRIGRPDIIHTDHARVFSGIPAAVGAAHHVCSPSVQTRLSLLERRFRAEKRP